MRLTISPDRMTLVAAQGSLKQKLLLRAPKSMLQRTFRPVEREFKSISTASLLTSGQFNGEIEKAKALWKTRRKVAIAFSLSHSSAGVGGRDGGFVRTVLTTGRNLR
ncbi:hypothetical protein [Mesorhizobium sp.]|uniref:hypothetical protein n=1 Tax=Mesorhizobium sp. TaxID=1871066 RepID=UPI000FE90D8C|nr:hypothetical protein [Mesorhizobium sp.]RWA71794.1 MAG: hypothetical protein EOQ29_09525 [Mesorhizobium sp.]